MRKLHPMRNDSGMTESLQIAVVAANGRVAQKVVKEALDRGSVL